MPDPENFQHRPAVTIIIPTTCEVARREALARAIDGVLCQQGVEVRLQLVVNGARADAGMLAQLQGDGRFSLVHLPAPGLRAARAHGRSLVRTEFFGFLDDDDELLQGALRTRCAPLCRDPAVDFVVTNGYRGAETTPHLRHAARIAADPVMALLEQNWVASCGGLYRSSACDQHYFDEMPDFLEWTALALRLLLAGKRAVYLDDCTFRVNDSPVSLSKSDSYRMATVRVLAELLRLQMPARVRRKLAQMLMAARHDLSVASLEQGQLRQAWAWHLQSLAGWSGLRYLSFTRRLLF